MTKLIDLVVGARPNVMKMAPIYHQLVSEGKHEIRVINTGQHSDANMMTDIFRILEMPEPEVSWTNESLSPIDFIASTMINVEKLQIKRKSDLVLIPGDVNSSLASAIACSQLGIPIGHIEAGLRSRDKTMPEENNRIVIDSLSQLYFAPSQEAVENLRLENIAQSAIHLVGNLMIDSLVRIMPSLKSSTASQLPDSQYVVCTFHRPSNVDNFSVLSSIVSEIIKLSSKIKIVWPVHPRTLKTLIKLDLLQSFEAANIEILKPLNYLEFIGLVDNSSLVITDSGGIQEETSYLGVPCLTVRNNTERPVTITHGTNKLIQISDIYSEVSIKLSQRKEVPNIPFWDGKSAARSVKVINEYLNA